MDRVTSDPEKHRANTSFNELFYRTTRNEI